MKLKNAISCSLITRKLIKIFSQFFTTGRRLRQMPSGTGEDWIRMRTSLSGPMKAAPITVVLAGPYYAMKMEKLLLLSNS
jgi:hypothetical protein